MILRHDNFATFKRYLMVFAFLFLAIANFAVFWVYVNFDTIRMTFFNVSDSTLETTFVGFKNYIETFEYMFVDQTSDLYYGFRNSFNALAINLIILPISVIVAYAFYKKIPGTPIFRVIFYLPSIISMVVLTTAFREMFGTAAPGPISMILRWMGISSPQGSTDWSWLYFDEGSVTYWPLIYTFCIFNGLGTNVILISSAMQRIPTEVSEAAKLDGCGFFRELRSIALPLVLPTIATWFLLIFGAIYSFCFQPMLIATDSGVNHTTDTLAWYIFRNAQDPSALGRLCSCATLGLCLSIIVMPLTLITRALFKKYTTEVQY